MNGMGVGREERLKRGKGGSGGEGGVYLDSSLDFL